MLLHFQPQSQCLVSRPYEADIAANASAVELAVDFIARAESSHEDLMAILEALRRRFLEGGEPVPPVLARLLRQAKGGLPRLGTTGCANISWPGTLAQRPRDLHCKTEQYYRGAHAACFENLREFYLEDVKLLRFPTHEL